LLFSFVHKLQYFVLLVQSSFKQQITRKKCVKRLVRKFGAHRPLSMQSDRFCWTLRTQHFANCEGSNLKEVQGSRFSSLLAARLPYWKGIDFLRLLCEKDFRSENNLFFLQDSVQGWMNGRFTCRNYSREFQFITSIC